MLQVVYSLFLIYQSNTGKLFILIFRTEMVKVYGNLDYSLLKLLYDKTFIIATILSFVGEGIFHIYQGTMMIDEKTNKY